MRSGRGPSCPPPLLAVKYQAASAATSLRNTAPGVPVRRKRFAHCTAAQELLQECTAARRSGARVPRLNIDARTRGDLKHQGPLRPIHSVLYLRVASGYQHRSRSSASRSVPSKRTMPNQPDPYHMKPYSLRSNITLGCGAWTSATKESMQWSSSCSPLRSGVLSGFCQAKVRK